MMNNVLTKNFPNLQTVHIVKKKCKPMEITHTDFENSTEQCKSSFNLIPVYKARFKIYEKHHFWKPLGGGEYIYYDPC